MKTVLTVLFVVSILTTAAYAKEVFKDQDMKDIRVVATEDGKAVIQDKHGTKREISLDDHIGRGRVKVVEIEKAYITVETDAGRTRMPVTYGFENR